jgi:hypothetical protein
MFQVAPRAGESEQERIAADRLTQIGRGLRELGIGWIAAYSPQAKGRIERSFLTAQDRLVKDLRLAKVSTMEAANTFLETEYWPEWNERFAHPIADFPNQHRALTPALELAAILCHVEQRVIGNDYTFSFAGRRYQIARPRASRHASPAGACRTTTQRRVTCSLSTTVLEYRRVRRASGHYRAGSAQAGSQRSQRGRQE